MSASSRAGAKTGEFGEWLTEYLKGIPTYQAYWVYYDHGDPATHTNVAAIKGIYGEVVSTKTQLAQVDVLVAKPNGEIDMVVEIEERYSQPKKLVGDVFTLLMCNRFAVRIANRNEYFQVTPETRLIVAGSIQTAGSKVEQLEEVILPRLGDFATPEDGVALERVAFVLKERMEEVVEELKGRFYNMFPMNQ